MKILVSPYLARLSAREGLLIPFVIWSALRDARIKQNLNPNPLKSQAKKYLRSIGLTYTDRHFQRIWNAGLEIFWGKNDKRLFMRGFRFVSERLEVFRKPCDASKQTQDLFVEIQLSKSLQALQAEIYYAYFVQEGEKTLSRATIQELFGFSPLTQLALEKILAERLRVFYNYAHINLENYKANPLPLPDHHFTIEFTREIRFDEDIETVKYVQYQLPNGFQACPKQHSEPDAFRASNRARYAMSRLLSQQTLAENPKMRYWLNMLHFERFGKCSDYVRVAYQGRKKLFLLGHYL